MQPQESDDVCYVLPATRCYQESLLLLEGCVGNQMTVASEIEEITA